jgi:hypothetical protein
MQNVKYRTPAALTALLVLASTTALGIAVSESGSSAQAATPKPTSSARIPAATSADAAAKATAASKAAAAQKAAAAAKTAAAAKAAAAARAAAEAKAAASRSVARAALVAPVQPTYANNLDGWIAQARDILAKDGDKVPSADSIRARAMTESSGNPLAENHWDSNEALYGGTYGLIQTIKPTFAQWALPGHTNILNPVDSIIAGVRYANDRYGSFETIAYGKQGY